MLRQRTARAFRMPLGVGGKQGENVCDRKRSSQNRHNNCTFFIILTVSFFVTALVAVKYVFSSKECLSLTTLANEDESFFFDPNGPPSDLIVHGKRDEYTKVPKEYKHKFLAERKGHQYLTRAFRRQGWQMADGFEECQIYHRLIGTWDKDYYSELKPWQRYSRIPGSSEWESKDGFMAGFQRYKKKTPNADLYFIPETYRFLEQDDTKAFQARLQQGGTNKPWVLKKVRVNNGRGIEMLAPNSEALKTAVERATADEENDYIIQSYICNELTWFHGKKFDLRFYWLVASIDPLIVLFHDGYVRVGAAAYNETDFSSTGLHLTNHDYRTAELGEVTSEDLWRRISEHYNQNQRELSKIIKIDPVQHVRSQIKEALGTFIAAFKNVFPSNRTIVPENLFGFYGCDFVIDNDLDVYFIEAQASPGIDDSYDYQVNMFGQMFSSMVGVVGEIQDKQEANAKANLLPLKNLQQWEIVYADDWHYTYKGYKRQEQKKSCQLG